MAQTPDEMTYVEIPFISEKKMRRFMAGERRANENLIYARAQRNLIVFILF